MLFYIPDKLVAVDKETQIYVWSIARSCHTSLSTSACFITFESQFFSR